MTITRPLSTPAFGGPEQVRSYENEAQFRAEVARQVRQLIETARSLVDEVNALDLSVYGLGSLGVINKTGSSIAADKLVAVTTLDTTSGKPKIVLADADVAAHDSVWVTTAAIANNAEGTVYQYALSAATLDTSGATLAGDAVYLSTTAGGFAHTAPTTSISRVHPVGMVVVKHATLGQIRWLIGPVRKVSALDGINGVEAGTYTPTFGNTANLDSTPIAAGTSRYTRIGSVVTVSGKCSGVDATAAGQASFSVSLPIASNFAGANDAAGVAFCGSVAGQGAVIRSSAANDNVEIVWTAVDLNTATWAFVFQYDVI